MVANKALRQSFSLALTNGLINRYQELPSAAFVAKEFNLRSQRESITQESARRWLRGLAIPEFDKLLILRAWLDIDLNALGSASNQALPKVEVKPEAEILTQQAEFVRATLSIKGALQELMKEIDSLGRKIDEKRSSSAIK